MNTGSQRPPALIASAWVQSWGPSGRPRETGTRSETGCPWRRAEERGRKGEGGKHQIQLIAFLLTYRARACSAAVRSPWQRRCANPSGSERREASRSGLSLEAPQDAETSARGRGRRC
ncbi:hypothetical protein AAFF_G00396000 [Aldrovandia affinis]|uniref:Uncharacterized protein n=1 Tax=Aldrovandia affinis TaxID=143900 RepID=A0AAD7SFI8_9TELE|nr:hypothetical protein AAFF_G00396000 [Aldrovandia affinis]